jgi:integrase
VLDGPIAHPLAHPFRGRLSVCSDRSDNAGNDRGSCACSTGATRLPVARPTCRRQCAVRSAKPRPSSRGSSPKSATARTQRRKVQRSANCSNNGSATTKTTWSPTVVHTYRRIIDRHLVPLFGRTPLRRLTTVDIDLFYAQLRKRGGAKGGPLSPASVKRVHAVLRRALAQSVKWGMLTINPAVNASPPREPRHEVSPPDPADVAALIAYAAENDRPLGCFLRLAATSGARRGELCALRWKHVDLENGALLIERSIVESGKGELIEKDTKTHAARRLRLDPGTVDRLREHRAARLGLDSASARPSARSCAPTTSFSRTIPPGGLRGAPGT